LDITSREWIEQCVEAYAETLLFVSHDRYFINRFATRIWELEDGKITDFRGTYEQYRAAKNAAAKAPSTATAAEKKQENAAEPAKPARRKGSPSPDKQLARLEREIAALEEKQRDLEQQREDFCTDYEKLIELDREEAALKEALDLKYAEWTALAEAM
jgi:ATPase subunit of ABC transporter with duplicated ATPase domains